MRVNDSRHLSAEAQYELRRQVVSLRSMGKSNLEISEATGVNRTHVSTIWQRYLAGGLEALRPKTRGLMHGEHRNLSPAQEVMLKSILLKTTPKRLQLTCALWTRETLRQTIIQETGVRLQLRTITDYLKRWGMTPPKPARLTYEQMPVGMKWWLDTKYPKIVVWSKQEMAEINWFTVSSVKNAAIDGDSLAESVTDALAGKTNSIHMISAINSQGKTRFMLYEGSMVVQVFIKFLSRLVRDVPRKVYLLIDSKPVRHGKMLKTWLEHHKETIELFYLPPSTPIPPSGTKLQNLPIKKGH